MAAAARAAGHTNDDRTFWDAILLYQSGEHSTGRALTVSVSLSLCVIAVAAVTASHSGILPGMLPSTLPDPLAGVSQAVRRVVAPSQPASPAAIATPDGGVLATVSTPLSRPLYQAWAPAPEQPSFGRTPPLASFDLATVRREDVVVARGDTLMQILRRVGVGSAEAHQAVSTLEELYDPRQLRIGQMLNIELRDLPGQPQPGDSEPSLTTLSINLDFENDIRVARAAAGGFDVAKVERLLHRQTHHATARVDASLYAASRAANVPDEALMQMIRLFSWDVDFQRDIQPGDSFEIVFDTVSSEDGRQRRVDQITYARLVSGGETRTAHRFVHDDGRVGYYDESGRSVRKWLMRTPIDGARMSSGFGKRRHPVLGYTKMHKGVDFAAPTGTPVYAAGDGKVEFAGRKGSYGNYLRIRHNDEFSTAYAHLDGFAGGIKSGARVQQGEVIGYVGSTGRSTGPHLHYEVLARGMQINPLKVPKQDHATLGDHEMAALTRQIERLSALRTGSAAVTRLAQR